jgi:putative transcriptional regulator
MNLKNRLKVARITYDDLTQEQLSKRVGCSRQTINSIENSRFVPSVELALRISSVLEMSVEEIFMLKGGEDD